MEFNPFGNGLGVGGRAVRAPGKDDAARSESSPHLWPVRLASLELPNPIREVAEDYGAVGEWLGVVRKEPPQPFRNRGPTWLTQGYNDDSAMLRMHQRNRVVEVAV